MDTLFYTGFVKNTCVTSLDRFIRYSGFDRDHVVLYGVRGEGGAGSSLYLEEGFTHSCFRFSSWSWNWGCDRYYFTIGVRGRPHHSLFWTILCFNFILGVLYYGFHRSKGEILRVAPFLVIVELTFLFSVTYLLRWLYCVCNINSLFLKSSVVFYGVTR